MSRTTKDENIPFFDSVAARIHEQSRRTRRDDCV